MIARDKKSVHVIAAGRGSKNAKSRNTGTAADRKVHVLHLEVDAGNGGPATLKRLRAEQGKYTASYKAKTSNRKLHYFFRHPTFPVPCDKTGTLLGPGINVYSQADVTAAELSKCTTGGKFRWVEGRSPSDVKLANLPPAWVQLIGERLAGAYVGRSAKSIGSADAEDVGRLVAQKMLDRFYAGGKKLVAVSGQLMAYKHGFWQPLDRQVVERKILELLPSIPGVGKVKHATLKGEVVDLLMTLQARDDDPFRRHSDPLRVINCRNGEVWLLDNGNVDLRPHSATSYLEHQVKIDYDPDATCPLYDQALLGIFSNASLPKAMVRHWHELVGYIIQPQRDHALVVVLFGGGNNGKTRLIQAVEKLMGNDLVCTGRVEELESDKFSLASLMGKRLFVDDDMHDGIKLPDGTLKKISERKLLTAELKYKNKFSFESLVVPVLLCNNVPNLSDISRGMLRRLQVIPFDTTFTPKTADPKLFNNIWASELPGVLN